MLVFVNFIVLNVCCCFFFQHSFGCCDLLLSNLSLLNASLRRCHHKLSYMDKISKYRKKGLQTNDKWKKNTRWLKLPWVILTKETRQKVKSRFLLHWYIKAAATESQYFSMADFQNEKCDKWKCCFYRFSFFSIEQEIERKISQNPFASHSECVVRDTNKRISVSK